jgi:hypothetical protein
MVAGVTWRQAWKAFALAGVIVGGLVGAALPAEASPSPPDRLDVLIQHGGFLSPDGQTITIAVLARCPERWALQQAEVTVTQPQASGSASFPLTCTGTFGLAFRIAVPTSGAEFELGQADVAAAVTVQRGRTEQVADARVVDVDPNIVVDFGDRMARLRDAGQAVDVDVTVACPRQTMGRPSRVGIFQGQISAFGALTPLCDGQSHKSTVTVEAADGRYQPGHALVGPFIEVEWEGRIFIFYANDPIQLV